MKIGVFLDRDGVINEEVHLLHKLSQLKLIPCVVEAIKKLNQQKIPVIVITNQTVVARGLCSENKVQTIHKRLGKLLKEQGAYLDAIYYCPHSSRADVNKYRLDCINRKPKPGLFQEAARKFKLDLKQSFSVGDQARDILAGQRAGVGINILVRTGHAGKDTLFRAKADYIVDDLDRAVKLILEKIKPWQ